NDETSQRKLITVIRKYQTRVVLENAIYDRHIDHGKGASLAYDACFLSGLSKIETIGDDGKPQAAWRPDVVYHFVQSQFITPDFVVDISAEWPIKMKAIKAFASQFHDPSSQEPETYISKPGFLRMIEAR